MRDAVLRSAFLLSFAGLGAPAWSQDPAPGVVVARVHPGAAAARAGLRPGDRLQAWRQDVGSASAREVLSSPFGLLDVEIERAPLGEVRLSGEREGAPLEVALGPDDWGLETRPWLEGATLAAYEEGRRRIDAGERAEGIERLRAAIAAAPQAEQRIWLLLEIARGAEHDKDAALAAASEALREADGHLKLQAHVQTTKGRLLQKQQGPEALSAAVAAYTAALALRREGTSDGLAAAASLEDLGLVLRRQRESQLARQRLEEAATVRGRLAPRSLAQAEGLCRLAQVLHEGGDLNAPIPLFQRGLELAESLGAPNRATGRCQLEWGMTVLASGRMEEAHPLIKRALEFYEVREPRGAGEGRAVSGLAIVESFRGDVAEAERLHLRTLALDEGRPPTVSTANTMMGLGVVAKNRGDLAEAERWYTRAAAIYTSFSAEGGTAMILNNLGNLAREQKDFARAKDYFSRALAMEERKASGSLTSAAILSNLSRVARDGRDLDAAESYARRSLEIREAKAPAHTGTAGHLSEMAEVLVARGRLDEAQRLHERALAIREKESPGTLLHSHPLHDLGMLELRRGNLDEAEQRHAQALAIRREVAPDSLFEAESSHALGVTRKRQQRTEEALVLLRRAVEALESQGGRLGGGAETRARFRAHYEEYYRDLEELLLEMGRSEEAFQVVERSRSRTLLALMAARDLRFSRDVPEDLERARRLADAAHDAALRELGSAPEARRAEIKQRLESARTRQAEVRARIRALAPRLAAVRDPESLDLAGVRKAIDAGTLALVYSLGGPQVRLYAIGPGAGEFGVYPLTVSGDALRSDVASFLDAIRQRRGTLRSGLAAKSRRLTDVLLGPVAARVQRAEQLLIVPDGPLHLLPFAALHDPSRPDRYLVEAKPFHTVASLTLFAELRTSGGETRPGAVVAGFGDPAYPSAVKDGAAAVKGAVRGGLRLDPLPWTRREVESLRVLAPSAEVWLGPEATEQRAKALQGPHRVVHFACHGISDADFPLESGLALAIRNEWKEGEENGLLQAWEVFESVRFDADLVTLSACETGLGKELRGEGMLSLTWAFQYAGARSVVASLWEVSDVSTAELMRLFYDHLGKGLPKAEALRRAQVAMLKRRATAAPYFWAAFQLTGDWR